MYITVRTRGQKTFHGLPLCGDHEMNLDPIKIPLLAGDITPIDLLLIEFRTRNPVIITHRHRKAINHINRFDIEFFPGLSQVIKEGHKQILKQMQSSIETTTAEHR